MHLLQTYPYTHMVCLTWGSHAIHNNMICDLKVKAAFLLCLFPLNVVRRIYLLRGFQTDENWTCNSMKNFSISWNNKTLSVLKCYGGTFHSIRGRKYSVVTCTPRPRKRYRVLCAWMGMLTMRLDRCYPPRLTLTRS